MDALERNIRKAIRDAKKDGIVGMSLANLKQVVSTTGLTCSVREFNQQFPLVASEVAKSLRFPITG